MQLSSLNTPALLLDQARLDQNIQTMNRKIQSLSSRLRPHLKTCKSHAVAERILKPGDGGVTVSTLKEAAYFLEQGYTDILYAVSIVPAKLPQIKELQDQGAKLILLLDTAEAARLVAEVAMQLKTDFPCMIEIDCDGKRAGLKPNDDAIPYIANLLHAQEGTSLAGVMTHAGGSYYRTGEAELVAMAEQERTAITQAAQKIRAAGLACPIVSMGSTPTALFAKSLEGVTEIRAGVFVFHDLVMQALGVCNDTDIALSVLSTVISHNRPENRILIDAGGLALSADPGKKNPLGQQHYGLACDPVTCEPLDNLWVTSTNQEHGLISLDKTSLTFDDLPIGKQLRILPNHACMTAAAYSGYHVTNGGSDIVDYWERCNHW